MRFRQGRFFVAKARAKLLMNKSAYYSDASKRIKRATGKEPISSFLTMLPITREELAETRIEMKTGEYAKMEQSLHIGVTISGEIIKLYKLIGTLNATSIKSSRKGMEKVAKGGEKSYSQAKHSNKKLKTNKKVQRDARALILKIMETTYPDEAGKQRDIDLVRDLSEGNKLVGAYLYELKYNIERYAEQVKAVKGTWLYFEAQRESIELCQRILDRAGTEKLSTENLAEYYKELLESGTLRKFLETERISARMERQQKKPKKPPIWTRVIEGLKNKEEKEVRELTRSIIDWKNQKTWSERKQWSVANKLDSRGLPVPEFLRKYIGIKKSDL